MQGGFGNESVIILLSKSSRALQRSSNNAHCLKLGPAVTDAVFIDCERLGEEFVRKFLEATLVGNLAAGDEASEAKFRRRGRDTTVQCAKRLMHELIQSSRLRRPIVFVMFTGFVFPRESHGGRYQCWRSVFDPFVTCIVCLPQLLEKLRYVSQSQSQESRSRRTWS